MHCNTSTMKYFKCILLQALNIYVSQNPHCHGRSKYLGLWFSLSDRKIICFFNHTDENCMIFLLISCTVITKGNFAVMNLHILIQCLKGQKYEIRLSLDCIDVIKCIARFNQKTSAPKKSLKHAVHILWLLVTLAFGD